MPLDFPLVSDVSLFHLCTKRPSIFHSHSSSQTECSTLHKSVCVWQNGRARFLHIDFTRINSLCPKHTYTCFCSSFMLVVCWLFLLTKALFSNCCDRRSGGLCDKKLGAKCGLEDIKSPSIPSNASTNWCFLSPSTIYFFSWRELAQRQEDDNTEQVPFLWSWGRLWGDDMMEVRVWIVMVSKCLRSTYS